MRYAGDPAGQYNRNMARGWDSKDVESQIESLEAKRLSAQEQAMTPEQMERLRQKEGLQLSRIRVLRDIDECRNERYRKILQASLAYLNAKLAELE